MKRIYKKYSKHCHYILTDKYPTHTGEITGDVFKTGRFGVADFSEDTILKRAKIRFQNYVTQSNPKGPKRNQRDIDLHNIPGLKMVILGKTMTKQDANSYENHMIDSFKSRDLLNKRKNRGCPDHAFSVVSMEAVVELPPRKYRKASLRPSLDIV